VTRLNRRAFIALAGRRGIGLGLATTWLPAVLAACGNGDDGAGSAAAGSPAASPGATKGTPIVGDVLDHALTSSDWQGAFGWVRLRLHPAVVDGGEAWHIRTDASDEGYAGREGLVFVPKILREATTRRVLTMEQSPGHRMDQDVDLAAEAIRLTRQLAALVDDPEVHGLLALMLLHHARRRSRSRPDGSIVPLAEQDRSQWDTGLIAEGIDIAQAALARDQLGEYQAQAAIAALHADAPRVEETDWPQIVEWYDGLLQFADTPIVRLNRAVAVGEVDGAPAGLAALAEVDEQVPRWEAVAAYLHEKNNDLELAARLYADAARNAPNLAERDHQTRQAARLNQHLQHHR